MNILILILIYLSFILSNNFNPLFDPVIERNLYHELISTGPYFAYQEFLQKANSWVLIAYVLGLLIYLFIDRMFAKKLIIVGSCGAFGLFGILPMIFGVPAIIVICTSLVSLFKAILFISLLHFVFLRYNKKHIFLLLIISQITPVILNLLGSRSNTILVSALFILISGGLFYLLLMRRYVRNEFEEEYEYEMAQKGNSIFSPITNVLTTRNLILITLYCISILAFSTINSNALAGIDYHFFSSIHFGRNNRFTFIIICLLITAALIFLIKFLNATDKIIYISLPLLLLCTILIVENSVPLKTCHYLYVISLSLRAIIMISMLYLIMSFTKKTQFHSSIVVALTISNLITNLFIPNIFKKFATGMEYYDALSTGVIITMVIAYILFIAINLINRGKKNFY